MKQKSAIAARLAVFFPSDKTYKQLQSPKNAKKLNAKFCSVFSLSFKYGV